MRRETKAEGDRGRGKGADCGRARLLQSQNVFRHALRKVGDGDELATGCFGFFGCHLFVGFGAKLLAAKASSRY